MNIFSALTGTLVNVGTVLLGSLVGLLLGKGLPDRVSRALMTALGLCTLYIGISGCLAGQNTLVIILSMVLGTAVGEIGDLDKWVNRLGAAVENRFGQGAAPPSPRASSPPAWYSAWVP